MTQAMRSAVAGSAAAPRATGRQLVDHPLPPLARLRRWLAAAGLREGARLPPERDLAATLGLSRAALRKALAVLEVEGALQRHVGRGTFLAAADEAAPRPAALDVAGLAQRTSPHEAMIARLVLEPELASLAAIHAVPRQVAEARSLAQAMRQVTDWPEYEALDARFHGVIAEGARNALLCAVHDVINAVRQSVVWGRPAIPPDRPPADYRSFAEHDAIVDAIERHDRAAAHAAMRAHLRATLAAMDFEK